MEPCGTTLLKPSPTPLMIAVPQSGPISRRPLLMARALRRFSCSTGTLSLKRKTCIPHRRACSASSQACSPATEITARFAASSRFSAISNERAGSVSPLFEASRSPREVSRSSATVRATSACASSIARTTISRSSELGGVCCSARNAAGIKLALSSNSRFTSVAMTAPMSSTPGRSLAAWATDIRVIES